MSGVGIIVGSGLAWLEADIDWQQSADTPWGRPSGPIGTLTLNGCAARVIARHGVSHTIAPHEINYRANVWALKALGVEHVIGVCIVGAIAAGFRPGDVAVPDQLIDYTWGRESSFGDQGDGIPHVEFTLPFDASLAGRLAAAAGDLGLEPRSGVYAVTQGPRLETAAEIDRLERDGCAMVGMTAMPEAVLAREAGLNYAVLAAAVNYAAGRSPSATPIHSELEATATIAMQRMFAVIERTIPDLAVTL